MLVIHASAERHVCNFQIVVYDIAFVTGLVLIASNLEDFPIQLNVII
jgi:hypothetical protein